MFSKITGSYNNGNSPALIEIQIKLILKIK